LLRRGDGGEDERDLPADHVGNRLPAAPVGNVLELDAGALLQQLARFHAPSYRAGKQSEPVPV
jgi:hypothetical protein